MDPYSDVVITDTSDNASNFVREYKIAVNDTYTITDFVKVEDPWNLNQEIKFYEGEKNVYLMQHIYYDGQIWRQSLDWDGMYKTTYEQSSKPDDGNSDSHMEMASTSTYQHPANGFFFGQELNMMNVGSSDSAQIWTSKITD